MGRKYAVSGSIAQADSTSAPLMNLNNPGTAIRPMVYDIIVGSGTVSPADNACRFQIQRSTTAGSTATTSITPQAIDPGDPAATATCFQGTYSTNPTLTASAFLLNWSQNQRATFRWVAAPTSELVIPATANNGIALVTPAHGGSTTTWEWLMLYAE